MNVFTTAGYVLMRIAQTDGDGVTRVTYKELAEEMGVTVRHVSNIINGLLNDGALLPEGGGHRRRVYINTLYHDDIGFAVMHLGRLADVTPPKGNRGKHG